MIRFSALLAISLFSKKRALFNVVLLVRAPIVLASLGLSKLIKDLTSVRGLSISCLSAAYIIPALEKNYFDREKQNQKNYQKAILTARKKTKKLF